MMRPKSLQWRLSLWLGLGVTLLWAVAAVVTAQSWMLLSNIRCDDDLFPIDEAIRFYNRTKNQYPDSTVSLLFADIGPPRAPIAGAAAKRASRFVGYATRPLAATA